MKKTGNFCIRVLCAIFIGIALGCSGASGESEIEYDQNQGGQQQGSNENEGGNNNNEKEQDPNPAPTPNPDPNPNPNPDPDPTPDPDPDPIPEPKYPTYYIDEEFGGQRFVAAGTEWFYDEADKKDTEFATCYDNAKKFLTDKVTDLKNDLAAYPNNEYAKTFSKALETYNTKKYISDNIAANYDALAPFLAALERPYVLNEDKMNYNKILASYHKLAHTAYNNSLGAYKDTKDYYYFRANGEMDHEHEFGAGYAEELRLAGYGTTDISVTTARNNMNTYLNNMANSTNISSSVLKKALELALYNESLYGLNDFAKRCKVTDQNFTTTFRNLLQFDGRVMDILESSISLNNLQSIDDGHTM